MKTASGVLNTFETVSGGFLNPNKFKLFIYMAAVGSKTTDLYILKKKCSCQLLK